MTTDDNPGPLERAARRSRDRAGVASPADLGVKLTKAQKRHLLRMLEAERTRDTWDAVTPYAAEWRTFYWLRDQGLCSLHFGSGVAWIAALTPAGRVVARHVAGLPAHEVEIVQAHTGVYTATCVCGWRGTTGGIRGFAMADMERHLLENRGGDNAA